MPSLSRSEDLRKFLLRTGVPRVFAELPFEGMTGEGPYREALERAGELAKEYLSTLLYRQEPIFLRLFGPFGSGKTRLACHLLRTAYLASLPITVPGSAPLFLRASDLVELRFRRRFGGDEDEVESRADALRDRVETADLLVLDDATRIAGYQGEEHFVERVVETRWEDRRSTVLTLNSDASLSPRFADFLSYFEEIPLAGRSRRGE